MAAVTRRGLYGGARSPYGDFNKAADGTKTFTQRVTRFGLYGGARSPYGSFLGKGPVGRSFVKRFTRLALYGGARLLYGSFAGKVATVSPDFTPELEPVHPPGVGRNQALRRRILEEDELLIEVIMAFLRIKDD